MNLQVKNIVVNIEKVHINLICDAYLHDTIEDTNTTFEELINNFGILVAYLVKELTSDKEMIKDLEKDKYLSLKLNSMSSWALDLKLCDRLANIEYFKSLSLEFQDKYIKETLYIIGYISKNRKLTKTHKLIINDILKIKNDFTKDNKKLVIKN